MEICVLEIIGTLKRHNQEIISPNCIIVNTLHIQNKENIKKNTKMKLQVTYKSQHIRIIEDFSAETLILWMARGKHSSSSQSTWLGLESVWKHTSGCLFEYFHKCCLTKCEQFYPTDSTSHLSLLLDCKSHVTSCPALSLHTCWGLVVSTLKLWPKWTLPSLQFCRLSYLGHNKSS